jgi:hypothetical protein
MNMKSQFHSVALLVLFMASLTAAAQGAETPRAWVLEDDLPGLDRETARLLRQAVGEVGYEAAPLSADDLCAAQSLADARSVLLVIPNGRSLPMASIPVIQRFLEDGGHLIVCGLPLWDAVVAKIDGHWTTQLDREAILSRTRPDQLLVDFAKEDLANWRRSTNLEQPAARQEIVPDGSGRALHVVVPALRGWDTFGREFVSPFPDGHALTCFRAKGDGHTENLMIEWQEQDGSRWIATVELTDQWQHYALPPEAFQAWEPRPGRGQKGDRLDCRQARRLVVGVAFSHMPIRNPRQEYWVADLGTAPNPLSDAPKAIEIPHLESLCPSYQFFPISAPVGVVQPAGPWPTTRPAIEAPPSLLGIHPRPGPSGLDKNRPWLRSIILEAMGEDGDYRGALATLTVPLSPEKTTGAWVAFTPSEAAFYHQPAVRRIIQTAARDLRRGLYLVEAGASYYTALQGQPIRCGAKIANLRAQPSPPCHVRLTITAPGQTRPAFDRTWPVTVGPHTVAQVDEVWTPPSWPNGGYRVRTELLEEDQVIQQISHELHVWQPKPDPQFIESRDRGFRLDGKPWKAHGVNYLPSSGVGLADRNLFEFWLGPAAYDPQIVRRDLERIRAMHLNAVSVFLYYDSLPAQNLLDLLRLCEELDLKVNLSLRPGTPLDFRWAQVREMIERLRLAENDTIFAYDLAWEPSHYDHRHQRQYAPLWREWIARRHGSLEQAEKAWGVAAPREDGQLSVPAATQLLSDGPWRRLVADYRAFLDDYLAGTYAEARRLVRSVDARHAVSFRMQLAGDPTHNTNPLPYDFFGLRNAVDIWEPEAYGRIGNWERVRPGHFTAAYARLCDPAKPVLWAEMGLHVWDKKTMSADETQMQFQAAFYRDFYRMLIESGADGVFFWWYPGGYRVNEQSDYGIINPDGTDRPVTRVIREQGPRFLSAAKPAPPDIWIEVDRDADARGLVGIYETVQEQYWRAIDHGHRPGLRWKHPPGEATAD